MRTQSLLAASAESSLAPMRTQSLLTASAESSLATEFPAVISEVHASKPSNNKLLGAGLTAFLIIIGVFAWRGGFGGSSRNWRSDTEPSYHRDTEPDTLRSEGPATVNTFAGTHMTSTEELRGILAGNLTSESGDFMARCVDPDPAARELQEQLSEFVRAAGLEVVYLISRAPYNVEHLLPLVCAVPGRLVQAQNPEGGLKDALKEFGIDQYVEKMSSGEIEKLAKTGKHILISIAGDVTGWWKMRPGESNGEGRQVYQNAIYLTHGIDEDLNWHHEKTRTGPEFAQVWYPSLLWTHGARRVLPQKFSPSAVKAAVQLDPSKKTVLVSTSMGKKGSFGDEYEPVFKELAEKYNIITRTHPLAKPPAWYARFPTASVRDFPVGMSVLQLADVVVSPPSGIMCSSLNLGARPVLMAVAKDRQHLESYGDKVLNDDSTEVWFQGEDLAAAVDRAAADGESPKDEHRRAYWHRKYGCIDGFEDYRTFLLILRDRLHLRTTALEDLYARIPGSHCQIVPSPDFV